MARIYLDESGDLGFDFTKSKTPKYFVVTILFTANRRPLEKLVKNEFARFSKNQLRAHGGTLHAHEESPGTRRRVLTGLSEKPASVMTIYLNKERVYTKLQDEKQVAGSTLHEADRSAQ